MAKKKEPNSKVTDLSTSAKTAIEQFPHFRTHKPSNHPALIVAEHSIEEYDYRKATHLIKELYLTKRTEILRNSCSLINRLNEKFGRDLSFPDQVPVYSNYRVNLHVGYKKFFEPYFLNGYYFGIANEIMDTEFVVPGGYLFLDEMQRVLDSRLSSSFPGFSSYGFEISRQADLHFYLIAQRGMLFDKNIRDLGVHVIEVRGMENKKNAAGVITKSVWTCREFENWNDAELYFEKGENTFTETTYENDGNIFDCFDSFEKIKEFMPPEGFDFDYLPHSKPALVSERQAKFYKPGEPKEFRGGKPKSDDSKSPKPKQRSNAA